MTMTGKRVRMLIVDDFSGHPAPLRPKLVLPVRALLEWAFGRECARVGEEDTVPFQVNVGTEYVLMERMRLGGVRIDVSRGVSFPAEDAEVVASVVSSLPSAKGGMGMAVRVAELARTGRCPDWMEGARVVCVPEEWRQCKHGMFAKTKVVGEVTLRHRGRKVRRDVTVCPVVYRPSGAQIAAARRAYLDWWGALWEIKEDLKSIPTFSVVMNLKDLFDPSTGLLRNAHQVLERVKHRRYRAVLVLDDADGFFHARWCACVERASVRWPTL